VGVHEIGHRKIKREQRIKLAKGEFVKSSGPSIGKDAWRVGIISLTHDLKESIGKVLRIHKA
jgi:hypothetical protein